MADKTSSEKPKVVDGVNPPEATTPPTAPPVAPEPSPIDEPEAHFDLDGYVEYAGLGLWAHGYLKDKLGTYVRPLSVWAEQGVK